MFPEFDDDEFKSPCALIFLIAWTAAVFVLMYQSVGIHMMLGWRVIGLLFIGLASTSAIGSIFSRMLVSVIYVFRPSFWQDGLGLFSSLIFGGIEIAFAISAARGVFELTL